MIFNLIEENDKVCFLVAKNINSLDNPKEVFYDNGKLFLKNSNDKNEDFNEIDLFLKSYFYLNEIEFKDINNKDFFYSLSSVLEYNLYSDMSNEMEFLIDGFINRVKDFFEENGYYLFVNSHDNDWNKVVSLKNFYAYDKTKKLNGLKNEDAQCEFLENDIDIFVNEEGGFFVGAPLLIKEKEMCDKLIEKYNISFDN